MAQGHVSIVLGVQSNMATVSSLYAQGVQATDKEYRGSSVRATYSPQEIKQVIQQIIHFYKTSRDQKIDISWALLGGGEYSSELKRFFKSLDVSVEASSIVRIETIQNLKADALLYIPIDVKQSRQIEQLARLTMLCPKVRHVTLAPSPKWNHAPLMALKETWDWVNPFSSSSFNSFAEEIMKMNGAQWSENTTVEEGVSTQAKTSSFVKEPDIISKSHGMREILTLVDTVADSDSTVLITGASGTGKELIAQRIHLKSNRSESALVNVNCGAIPADLLESELFGHVKGAFTGAVQNREGKFAAAENGTLFLDEIGEMPVHLQVKLLRVLQSKEYEAVGSNEVRQSNARIIAATNQNLEQLVEEGKFREDLYYRINVIPVQLPSLSERLEDVQKLIEFFIARFNREKNRRVTGVTRSSLRALCAYEWPGNIRELENLMERMVIIKASGMIDALDFPEKYRRKMLSEIEYNDIINKVNKVPSLGAFKGSSFDEINGEDIIMNDNHGFVKAHIDQGVTEGSTQTGTTPTNVTSHNPMGASVSPYNNVPASNVKIEEYLKMLSENFRFPEEGLDFNAIVDRFENILILAALTRTGWNRNRAAGLLRLNRTTLVEKLKKKGLTPPPKETPVTTV